jgi:PTH1 family peptidyl-tRNA hydrolase
VRAIVGIGNPGSRYKNNRHNVGFQLLDYFAEKKFLIFRESKFDYYYSEGEISQEPFVLIKPSTYVNLSGVSVHNCISNYKIDVKDLLILVDDINIDFASARVRKSGGNGGHNGLNSIIYHLNSDEFPRLKIGIGNNFENGFLPDYVLSDFDEDEMIKLKSTFELGTQLIESFIIGGFDLLLSTYSRLLNNSL